MHQHKDYLFVEVPIEGIDHWIINNGKEKVGVNWYIPNKVFGEEGNMWSEGFRLPEGTWQIIGKGDELTEEQWNGIVDDYWQPGEFIGWTKRDYTCPDPNVSSFDTAIESGHSLLKSLSLEPGKTLILKKE